MNDNLKKLVNDTDAISDFVTQVSDIYIPVKKFDNSTATGDVINHNALDTAWFYVCGEKITLNVSDYPMVMEFAQAVLQALNNVDAGIDSDDVNDIQVKVVYKGTTSYCRVHKENGTSYGVTFAVRIQPEVPPSCEEMTMPFMMYDLLMHPSMEKGGLIILVAGLGAGKTTTVSATVRSRLTKYGGLGVTIEDPAEHNMMGKEKGRWGKGRVIQKTVSTSRGEKFADAVRASLRMFPATPGNMLFLGEIRDSETAEHALTSAANGSLVLATVHGNDAASGLDRFLSYTVNKMGRELSYNMLRDCLRLTIFQSLNPLTDGGGEGDWGKATPRIEMIHNLIWKGNIKGEIESGFDVENGIKKGMQNVVAQQKGSYNVGKNALNKAVNLILKGMSAAEVFERIHRNSEDNIGHLNLMEHDFRECCEYVANNKLDDKAKKRLIRTDIEWQTQFEPAPFINLRSRIVAATLQYYYEKS